MTPFTTAQAGFGGWSPKTLRNGQAHREHHGVYLEPGVEQTRDLSIAAARLVLPDDALLDGVSALQALGVEVGASLPLRFVSTHPHHVRRPGIRVRRVRSLPVADGCVLTPVASFVSAAQELDLVELVTAGDWLVRLGHVTVPQLVDAARIEHGRGAVRAGRAAGLVRERVDSPRETRLRLCLVLAGLPEPETNPEVFVRGRSVGRVDLYLKRWLTSIEYEGDQHRTDRRQWNVDIRRGEQLGLDGGRLVRVTAERMAHPRAVVALVLTVLRAAGYDGPAPTFSEEWHQLFSSAR